MKSSIIIPFYNEQQFLKICLESVVCQSSSVSELILVNDNSTDNSLQIALEYQDKYDFIKVVSTTSDQKHIPGSKIINAFYKGFNALEKEYDVIFKLDADLILPQNYFEEIIKIYKSDNKIGMVGGICVIEKNNSWVNEGLTNNDHIRGALKSYSKECFAKIGQLKNEMGWDSVDELLARFHNYKVVVNQNLKVKHLKPTGSNYSKNSAQLQGKAFYKMRYGFMLTLIASVKLALLKQKPLFLFSYLIGYFKAKNPFVTKEEGKFIRNYRWKKIRNKLQ